METEVCSGSEGEARRDRKWRDTAVSDPAPEVAADWWRAAAIASKASWDVLIVLPWLLENKETVSDV